MLIGFNHRLSNREKANCMCNYSTRTPWRLVGQIGSNRDVKSQLINKTKQSNANGVDIIDSTGIGSFKLGFQVAAD
jgi:hypothetical protein